MAIPGAGFEPTIPMFKRFKTIRALDCAVLGTGPNNAAVFTSRRMRWGHISSMENLKDTFET
jgi:hypothetical protein